MVSKNLSEESPVLIYMRPTCPYCVSAKSLLESKGVSFTVIDINQQPEKRNEMIERAGGRTTVPQIFIKNRHIGGFDDLSALNGRGELDPLLAP